MQIVCSALKCTSPFDVHWICPAQIGLPTWEKTKQKPSYVYPWVVHFHLGLCANLNCLLCELK